MCILFFTGTSLTDLRLDGISQFRKGLDVAGGVRLTYKVDMSKYREVYTNEQEFFAMRNRVLNVITKNIDTRISKLGVSDYESKVMTLSDGDYLVIEIGGLNDVEEAKKQIGKTVELEFKLLNPQKDPTSADIAKRYSLAQDLLVQINKNPQLFAQLAQGKGSSDIFYTHFTGATLDSLPAIYGPVLLQDTIQSGKVYPQILSWLYANFQDASGMIQSTTGFVLFKINAITRQQWGQISDAKIKTLADQYRLPIADIITKTGAVSTGVTFAYDPKTKKITIQAGEVYAGQEVYQTDLYILPKSPDASLSGIILDVSSGSANSANQNLINQAYILLTQGKNPTTVSGVTLLMSGQRIPYQNIAQVLPNYTYNPQNPFATGEDANAIYLFKLHDYKPSNQSVYRTITLSDVKETDANTFIDTIKSEKLYDIEEIFVRDRMNWIPALDSKSRLLNGAFFQMATVGQDSTGRPAVAIHFNEDGKEIFCDLTEKNINQQMAIFVGWELKTAPTIQDKICGWQAIINGQTDNAQRDVLIKDLNEGALPAQLILSHEETIDPTLWSTALHGALIAWLVWLVLIFVYMWFLYGWTQALICMATLACYLIILMAFLKLIGYALSLSSIAAILLNIGISVDVCILIYERLKEELAKGKSLTWAIQEAYQRSIPPIRDGNVSILLIGVLLFMLGINVFKGFGTMMVINFILTFVVVLPVIKEILLRWYKGR